MPKKNYARLLKLARSTEARLKALPRLIRKEFRSTANRQVNALVRVERSVETLTRQAERQRVRLEKTLAADADVQDTESQGPQP